MLSSVCGGASRGSRRCTCRLRSQHKLSECLSGSECVVLHFEHLEIGGRGELISYEHLYTQCHHPTLGLDVRNGRFVQSPEVGLRSYSCVFPYRRDLLARLSARLIRLDDKVCDICKLSASLLFCHPAVVCVGERDSQCALCVKGCHRSSHTVTPYCVAVMGILSCHAIINIPPGKSKMFAMYRRVYGS